MSIQQSGKTHPQSGRRSHAFLSDQHGRTYSAVIEQMPESNHPTGPVTPCVAQEYGFEVLGAERSAMYDQWARENDLWPYAPVLPPEKYVVPNTRNSAQVVVDYDAWRTDVASAHDSWWTAMTDAAKQYYKDEAANVMEKVRKTGEVPRYLHDLLGERPMDLRIVDTCAAGKSRWILGLPNPATGEPLPRPAWADEILPLPVEMPEYEGFSDDVTAGFSDDQPWEREPESLDGALEPARNRGGRPRKQAVEA